MWKRFLGAAALFGLVAGNASASTIVLDTSPDAFVPQTGVQVTSGGANAAVQFTLSESIRLTTVEMFGSPTSGDNSTGVFRVWNDQGGNTPQANPFINTAVNIDTSNPSIFSAAINHVLGAGTYWASLAGDGVYRQFVMIAPVLGISVSGNLATGGIGAPVSLRLTGIDPDEQFNDVSAVPVPAALPLLATAFAGLGFLSWRKRRKAAA